MELNSKVAELEQRCIYLRRELHKIPETKHEEFKTQQFIIDELEKYSPDKIEKMGGTGVRAVFFKEGATETVAFRADMDALVTQELNEVDYISTHPGKMHACGHDGHMTILLLMAELIASNREDMIYNIVLIFQPAEEGGGGAKNMVDDGVLLNPKVNRIYGLHVWPTVKTGKVGVRWETMMAQTAEFDILVHGRSAHGASPQLGIDAVVAAAQLISTLQTAITRSLDPHEDAILTIGKISGGQARNIIADKVEMNATLRAMSEETYNKLSIRINEIVNGISVATRANITTKQHMAYPCVYNPRWMVENFYKYISMDDVVLVEPVLAAEDFSVYQKEIPGLFFFLGVGTGKDNPPLHNSKFNFDEKALLNGLEIFWRLTTQNLK